MFTYDYLIVGAGLYGAIFAYEATKHGKRCIVVEKRSHVAGNLFGKTIAGIQVHQYGPHIFHTNNKRVWDYVNQFAEFNNYVNSPLARYKEELYNLPFNMNTFHSMWGVITPEEARAKIKEQVDSLHIKEPRNLEEQALMLVGSDVYEKLIKGYTEKQWGRDCKELPAFIIKRLPLRFTYNNNYFNDRYQGIPVGGYNQIIENMLAKSDVLLNTDFFDYIGQNPSIARKTVYTGMIDRFFHYKFGELQYRSVRFDIEELPLDNFQGNAVINYTQKEIPFTRIIEYKHFEFGDQPTTVISREFPSEWSTGAEPYYPINDEKNMELYKKYKALSLERQDVIFGGRLAEYKYYDMDKVIESALETATLEDIYKI